MPLYEIIKRRQLFGKVYEPGERVNVAMEYDQVPPDWQEYLAPPKQSIEVVVPSPAQ